jgi:hypothetical protein
MDVAIFVPGFWLGYVAIYRVGTEETAEFGVVVSTAIVKQSRFRIGSLSSEISTALNGPFSSSNFAPWRVFDHLNKKPVVSRHDVRPTQMIIVKIHCDTI